MSTDEREIFHFLKTCGVEFINAVEIARRAGGKKRFHEDEHWAKPILLHMAERRILESDVYGRFRIKPVPRKDKNKRWVAPDIAKILEDGGMAVESTGDIAPDEYYDEL